MPPKINPSMNNKLVSTSSNDMLFNNMLFGTGTKSSSNAMSKDTTLDNVVSKCSISSNAWSNNTTPNDTTTNSSLKYTDGTKPHPSTSSSNAQPSAKLTEAQLTRHNQEQELQLRLNSTGTGLTCQVSLRFTSVDGVVDTTR